ASALIMACVAVLIAGQALQSGLYVTSQAAGQVNNTYYGYPVGELQSADAALAALQHQQGTAETYISAPIYYTYKALTYMLVSERPGRALVYGDCLVLPPAESPPSLVVSTHAESQMARLLSQLPNARLVRTWPMPGNEPFQVYRVQGSIPTLPGERMLPSLIFQDGFGNTMRLDGVGPANGSTLRLRWTVLRMTSPSGAPRHFYVDARATRSGAGTGAPLAHVECDPTTWQNGATIFTWVSTAAVTPPTQPAPPLPATVAISAWDQDVYYAAPIRHGLRMLTSDLVQQSPAQLVAMNPQHTALPASLAMSQGELVTPTSAPGSP
ncbi:MAG TPA: hypothetical protein VKT52_01270, partial [Ktedonobacterales bacterium]|nr:hypothetical protein [Ktedonobacterales bacterium]